MTNISTLHKRFKEEREKMVTEFASLASVLRIAGWSLFFLFMFLLATRTTSNEPDRTIFGGYISATGGSYDPLGNIALNKTGFRIAVIGSSEAIDYRHHQYSLGLTIAEVFPRHFSLPIDVIERSQAMLSFTEKKKATMNAINLQADLIVISIPLHQLGIIEWQPPAPDVSQASALYRVSYFVLSTLQAPQKNLDQSLAYGFPKYQLQLSRIIRPPVQQQTLDVPNAPATTNMSTNDGQEVDVAQPVANAPERELRIEDIEKFGRQIAEGYKKSSPVLIAETLEALAEPAKHTQTPVLFLISPVHQAAFPPKYLGIIQDYSDMVDEAIGHISDENISVINALTEHQLAPSDFVDLVHINNYEPIVSGLLETVQEKNLLPGRSNEEDSIEN